MKILSINIRATQGGAGRMGVDLHRRLACRGKQVQLIYGYGSGIKPDPQVDGDPSIAMLGSKPGILTNYIAHWLTGRDLKTVGRDRLCQLIAEADIVHIHAAHHWYLNWTDLMAIVRRSGIPVVMTAHDWWLITGRCGFVRECTGWQRACGECGDMRFEDLPSLLDRSRSVRLARQAALKTIAGQLIIVCPSHHLQRDHASIYPDIDVRFIPNALDIEFENALGRLGSLSDRKTYVFCASDLDSPGKVDRGLVERMARRFGSLVTMVGRNSPFSYLDVTEKGEVRAREELAKIFSEARALLFTSTMDNAPLTIIEALTSGCFVVAYQSAAAEEMVRLVGGRCAATPDEAFDLVSRGCESELFGGLSHTELALKARAIWSGDAMANAYLNTYEQLLSTRDGRHL
jgi:putative colanic acid biosynthesis glycosyltransferase